MKMIIGQRKILIIGSILGINKEEKDGWNYWMQKGFKKKN